jgi:2-polyprenyl-3-methyl-5-hydroxy-6-metoxy-1,4-benzoquinol methylase
MDSGREAVIDPRRSLYPRPKLDQVREPEGETSHALMLDMIGVGKRVLELGCSNGYMSRLLKQRNCQLTGVEVDPLAANEARAFCDEVIVADLDTRPLVDLLPGTPFDVAVFGDVLEHLRDPWRVLDETRAFLAPGSFAVLSIPNIAHGSVRLALLRGSFDYQPQGLLDSTHLRFFTLRSIHELCMRSGYRIEEIRRTKADLFAATDLLPSLDPSDFEADLVAKVRSDPEHDTVQFVIKAVPLTDEERVSVIVSRVSALEAELVASNEKSRRLQTGLDAHREEVSGLTALNGQLSQQHQAASDEATRLTVDLAQLREEASGLVALNRQLSLQRENADSESLTVLAQELRERRDDIAALSAALTSSQVIRERLAADLRYQETNAVELDSIRARVVELERECAEFERKSAAFDSERADAAERGRLELEEERQRANDLELELERAQTGLRELQRRLETEGAELLKVREERVAFEVSIAQLHRASTEQTRAELRKVLEEIALTDAAIQATYRSRAWALKRILGKLRGRLRRRGGPR